MERFDRIATLLQKMKQEGVMIMALQEVDGMSPSLLDAFVPDLYPWRIACRYGDTMLLVNSSMIQILDVVTFETATQRCSCKVIAFDSTEYDHRKTPNKFENSKNSFETLVTTHFSSGSIRSPE